MREFIFTPVHTIPVDKINRILIDPINDIYKDIQNQLRPSNDL